jgi:hypothetical protein
VMQARGTGSSFAFDQSRLNPGLYVMRVQMAGDNGPHTKRYMISETL